MGSCQGNNAFEPEEPRDVEDVVIYLDDATDETPLSSTVDGYSDAEPTMRRDIRPPVDWYDPEEDEYKPEQDMHNSCADLNDDKLELSNMLRTMDEHAYLARTEDAESYPRLIAYLTEPINEEKDMDILKVRSLISWLACQKIENLPADESSATVDTPNGYLQLQKQKKATFASIFTASCRHADIQCVLIHGDCKAGNYQPGDKELERCTWTAVNIAGNWHFVHPYWVCRVMIGDCETGWIRLESDGKTISEPASNQHAKNKMKSAFRETYFLPRAEDFKYVCYPDDPEWQLLPPEKRVKSEKEFCNLPFLLPGFFGLNLSLVSTQNCELETKTGLIDIIFKCKKRYAFKTVMTYDLYIRDVSDDDNELLQSGNFTRLVLNNRCENKFTFQIRFPAVGVYKIVFYAGYYGQAMVRVSEFKLNCLKKLENCLPLPIEVGSEGWGPGPKLENVGLILPSHQSGVINLKIPPENAQGRTDQEDNTAHIRFAVDQEKIDTMDYSAEMIGGGDRNNTPTSDDDTADPRVQCEVDHQRYEMKVKATMERAGECALVIKAGKKGGRKRSVCNYLLTSLQGIREGVPQRKARKALKRALSEESNLDELTDLIEKCHKAKLTEEDDDVKAAKHRHTFLLVKQHLLDCVKRRNLGVTEQSLKEVSKYRHKLALIVETRRAEKLQQQLERLGGFTHDVPKLDKACKELVNLNNPKPEVPATMKALFMLLNEPVDCRLDDWCHLQSLLRVSKDNKRNVLNRMEKISEQEMGARSRRKVQTQLYKYTEDQVRHTSQAAASFYIWTDGVLGAFGDTVGDKADKKPDDQT